MKSAMKWWEQYIPGLIKMMEVFYDYEHIQQNWIFFISYFERNCLGFTYHTETGLGIPKNNAFIIWTCSKNIPCICKSRNRIGGEPNADIQI